MRTHRLLRLLVLTGAGGLLAGCAGTHQPIDLGPSDLSTPPHSLSRSEYPFDASGRYVDAWAAEGATRYPASMDSDDDRRDRPTRSVKPPEPRSRKIASTPPRPSPKAKSKPPAKGRTATVTVKPGDTLFSLSKKHGVTIAAIKRANGLTSDLLRDGRRLLIPK